MTSQHHVSELDAIHGTKSRPESGPSWDHVGTKSGPSRDQVIFQPPTQSPTQLHKISPPSVCYQVCYHTSDRTCNGTSTRYKPQRAQRTQRSCG